MKALHFIGILIVALFFSCNEGEESKIEETRKLPILSLEQCKKIGEEHNKILDHVLAGLKKRNLSFEKNKDNIEDVVNEEFRLYYQSTITDPELLEIVTQESEKMFSKSFQHFYRNQTNTQNTKSSDEDPKPLLRTLIEDHAKALSINQLRFLNEIDEILQYDITDVESAMRELDYLSLLAALMLNKDEMNVILVAIETAKSSITYWNSPQNLDAWERDVAMETEQYEEYHHNPNKNWFSWSQLIGADVAGAVGASIKAAFINAIPVAGPLGYGATITGTAAAASAASAVGQVWDHYHKLWTNEK